MLSPGTSFERIACIKQTDVYRTPLKNIFCKGIGMTFQQLGIIPSILNALKKEAYVNPTPIQEQAVPPVLKKKESFGMRPDGHGKDGCFRCANPSASCRTGKCLSKEDSRPCFNPDEGIGPSDSGEFCGI